MYTPAARTRLRSACVLLSLVERHAEAIAAWFATSEDPELPMTAAEAAENVRELMQGYAEVLVARSRTLAALDDIEAARLGEDPVDAADARVRAALGALRTRLGSGVGLLAMEKADLERPLPRRPGKLAERAEASQFQLAGFFEAWRKRKEPWPLDLLVELDEATRALRATLAAAPPPGPATVAHAAALDAFDEAFDDAAELVQAMLQLADRGDVAETLEARWALPGVVADPAARDAVSPEALAALLGEVASMPARGAPIATERRVE